MCVRNFVFTDTVVRFCVQIAALRFFGKCYLDLLNLNFELELVDLDCVVDFGVFEELF